MYLLLSGCLSFCFTTVLIASPLSVVNPPSDAIGLSAEYYKETDTAITLDQAVSAGENRLFQPGKSPFLNFGIGSRPIWVHFSVDNDSGVDQIRRLSIETAWLDKIDIYFRTSGNIVASYQLGDRQPFDNRPIKNRFFAVDHTFEPGISEIYIRVETTDPMVIPIFLQTIDAAFSTERWQGYSYGLVYGFLLALIAYNAMLYIGMRGRRHIFYSLYLVVFVLANIAYTGHGFAWLWPNQTGLQLWIIPFLMVAYGMSGLLFASVFLETRLNFPKLHRAVVWICAIVGLIMLSTFALGLNALNMFTAFVFVAVFSVMMLYLGIISVRAGYKPARFFLAAAAASMTGVSLTALSVSGVVSYNVFSYRAAEIGMLIDAILLALALAYQFRTNQNEKFKAEQMARIDPLTGLNNRRAFYELAKPLWSNAQRNQREISIILLDIDEFKSINDRYGHAQGDIVLMEIGSILANSARDGDIVARWGGEEFILILPETNLVAAAKLAERLRSTISTRHISYAGGEFLFTASFGVAQKTDQTISIEELTKVADQLLYQSKQEGRNRVSSDSKVNNQAIQAD